MDWSGVSRTLETHAKAVAASTASMAESSPGCLSVPDLQRRQANKRHERRWIGAEPEQSEGQAGEKWLNLSRYSSLDVCHRSDPAIIRTRIKRPAARRECPLWGCGFNRSLQHCS